MNNDRHGQLSRRQLLAWGVGTSGTASLLGWLFTRRGELDYSVRPPGLTHGAITTDLLHQLPDHEVSSEVFDYVLAATYADNEEEGLEILRGLSAGLRATYTTLVLEGEVCNGGFEQFLSNSSGLLAHEAHAGYVLLGAHRHAQIVTDAIELERTFGTYDSSLPESPTYREKKLRDNYQYADFTELDTRLYEATEPIDNLRVKYIREHPGQFVGPAIG